MTPRRCHAALFAFSVALASHGVAVAEEVKGPNGDLVVTVELRDGKPAYAVKHKGNVVLEPSPLGLETSIGDFASGLTADGSGTKAIDTRPPHGKATCSTAPTNSPAATPTAARRRWR